MAALSGVRAGAPVAVTTSRRGVRAALFGIICAALVLRLVGVRFGLPALYDPDEGFFLITGLKLIGGRTLNPEWFGHPGTITIYCIAIVELAVLAWQRLSGAYPDVPSLVRGLYADPSMVVVPLRLMIVACGVAGVALTQVLGRKLLDTRTALLGAALLALNPLHISLSQIVRTDIQASLFILACLIASAGIVRDGRRRDYVLAAIFVGLGAATKWPASSVAVAIPGACLARCTMHAADRPAQIRCLLLTPFVAVGTLLAVSPFLVLDYPILLSNLAGEASKAHLGATGGSLSRNLAWYFANPLRASFGLPGVLLIAFGVFVILRRHRAAAATLLPASGAFIIAISAQGLIWARWIVPILPILALLAAVGFWALLDLLRNRRLRLVAGGALALLIVAPIGMEVAAQARERLTDTRAIASAWAKRNFPPGSRVLVEYLAFDLLPEPWSFAFPAGWKGCADGRTGLAAKVGTRIVTSWRAEKGILNIGTINPARLKTCRADFAIYSDYDRYVAERAAFPQEAAVYETLQRGGRELFVARPVPGRIGGPVVRVVALGPAYRFR